MSVLARVVAAATVIPLTLLAAGCDSAVGPTDQPPGLAVTPAPELAPAGDGTPPPLVPALALPDDAVGEAVARLDGLAEELMKSSGVPGLAVAVVHGGKTVYAKGFGVKDVRRGDDPDNRVDPDTVFQLASLSKPIGATVVAQQVGEKRIGWDTPIVGELPWFALSDPAATRMVTVGDMYAHRSGLPDHAGDKLEDLGYDRRTILERLGQEPLDPFRISYAYTNFGVTAAAEAVASGAGESWEELSRRVLYEPLGMSSTSSEFADYADRADRAVGHLRTGGHYEPAEVRDPDPQAPAGGVSSTVNDLTHWLSMLLADGKYRGRQVVDTAALLPALTPQIVSSPPDEPAARSGFYGYGFNVGTTSGARVQLSHSGAFLLGAGSNFVAIPSADVAIVALTNATPSGVPEALTAEFADLVQFGEIREDWPTLYGDAFAAMDRPVGSLVGKNPPADPAPAAPAASYVGTYANEYWGPATVTERGGELGLSLGPRGEVWPLTHWDGDVFTFGFVSENSPPGSISTATFDGDRLTLEYFDDNGKGTFTR
ncbi:serine hydrolase [Mycolicibacterium palauense]|uniref:serine hydrolase n=1 Tax=Mycolicibacterium palauense TaxID=2034511 RepID=UPI000BFEB9D9|nr:serine hydrolase [Mycolicibacterium palauense]